MKQKYTILGIIVASILIFFLLMHIVQYTEINGLQNIERAEQEIRNTPFDFYISDNGFKLVLILTSLLTVLMITYFLKNKNYMHGKEHGTASWGTKKDSSILKDYNNNNNNIILSNTEYMSLDTRKHHKNLNQVIIGGPGSGKSRFCVKPNLLQLNTSYVVTDPKGELLSSTLKMMNKKHYRVKVLNLLDMECGNQYNPFKYIKNEVDVLKMIDVLIKNTTPDGSRSNDPFWEKSEKALLQSICFLLNQFGEEEEKNFSKVMEFLRYASVKEEEENYISRLDAIFIELEEDEPENIAVKQYKIFKQASGKTAKTILVSLGVRLAPFNIESVRNLTAVDTMNLSELGDTKTILYIVIPDSDSTFNFIATMLFTQMFTSLYRKADSENGRLKHHVRLMMDEFANIGTIPEFDKILATCRSREISATIIIQGLSQLKKMYKEAWETILTTCSTLIYLGSQEQSTHEYISKALGKRTIYHKGTSRQRGRNGSYSVSENVMGRELMTPDEIQRLDNEKCIVLVQGMRPFFSDKFKLEKHKNYSKLADTIEDYFKVKNLKRGVIEKKVKKKEDGFSKVVFK